MHPVFRFRHALAAAAVLGVGLLPVFAQRPLGIADTQTILAEGNITATGTVTSPGGNVCAVGTISGTTIAGTASSQSGSVCQPAVNAAISAASSLQAKATATSQTTTLSGTISPGSYTVTGLVSGTLTLADNATFSLNGNGVYIFYIPGNLVVGNNVVESLGGANAANVYFVVSGNATFGTGDTWAGNVIASGNISDSSAAMTADSFTGNLQSTGGSISLADQTTVTPAVTGGTPDNSFIFPPPASGSGVVQTGPSTFSVCPGDTYSFTATATAGSGTDGAQLSAGPVPSGLSFSPNVGGPDSAGPNSSDILNTGTGSTSSTATFTPSAGQAGNTYTVTFYSLDTTTNVISSSDVTLVVPIPPSIAAPSNVTGTENGNGTVGNPFVVCANTAINSMPLAFDLAVSGAPGENVTLTTTAPVTGLTIAAPTTQPTPATFHVTFNPGATESTVTATFVATSSISGCMATESITIRTDAPPTFTAGPANGTIVTACVGQQVSFDVTATDPDGTTLLVEGSDTRTPDGLPLGALQSPNELGTDTLGSLFDPTFLFLFDVLTGSGFVTPRTPTATSRFLWTPTAADLAFSNTYSLIYAARDSAGCIRTNLVVIFLTTTPTVSATNNGQPIAANQVVTVCPGQTLSIPVTGAGAATSTISLSATGLPSGATLTSTPGVGSATGTVTFTPPVNATPGNSTVTVTATDTTFTSGLASGPGITQCNPSASLTFVIRVASVPTITATDNTGAALDGPINTCPGSTVTYRIHATSTEGGDVTIGVPVINTPEGAPSINPVNTPTLPTSDNPAETTVTFTAPVVTTDTTYTLTYTATDANGCTSQVTVTVVDQAPVPSFLNNAITVTTTPAGPIEVNSQVCYTVTVVDQCGNPIPGFTVTFTETGTAGISGPFTNPFDAPHGGKGGGGLVATAVTDANGNATVCLTVLTAGTITVTASGPGISTTVTTNVTIPVPATSLGCEVSGSGIVDSFIGVAVTPAQFNVDVSTKQSGRVKGQINFSISAASLKGRSTALTALTCADVPGGSTATLFGTMRFDAPGVRNQTLAFRADFLDLGTPGVPNDRVTFTFFNADGSINPLSFGSNLRGVRIKGFKAQNDIKIRGGVPAP